MSINMNEAAAIRREATRTKELARQLGEREHIPAAIRCLVLTASQELDEAFLAASALIDSQAMRDRS
jgi:hypothetical protein